MKKILVILCIIICSLKILALPLSKKEYLFREDDASNISMGYSLVNFENKLGFSGNNASITQNTNSYTSMGFSKRDYTSLNRKRIKANNKFSFVSFMTNQGGLYYRHLYFPRETSLTANHKYNFEMGELGLVVAKESENYAGLFTGITLKMYNGNILEGKTIGSPNLVIDRCLGYGIDFGILYKKGSMSFGFSWEDMLGRIYWSKYDNVLVNGRIGTSVGLDLGILKYGISMKKVLIKGEKTRYGQGIELKLFQLPDNVNIMFLNSLKLKLRMGTSGNTVFARDKYSYGIEASNDTIYLAIGKEDNKFTPFKLNQGILESSIGILF